MKETMKANYLCRRVTVFWLGAIVSLILGCGDTQQKAPPSAEPPASSIPVVKATPVPQEVSSGSSKPNLPNAPLDRKLPTGHIKDVFKAVDQIQPVIEEAARTLWKHSERSHVEHKSAAYLIDALKKSGFKISSEGSANVPTAFVAKYGSGKPIIAIMTEYDALPDLGNEPVTEKKAFLKQQHDEGFQHRRGSLR